MSGIKDKVAVVGMGCTRFGELWDKGTDDLVIEACYEAFEDARIEPRDIQAAWFGSVFSGGTGTSLARPLKLECVPVTRVENICCTGVDALRNAAYAVAAGAYDVVLVCGMEKLKDHYPGFGSVRMNPLDSSKVDLDFPPVNHFAKIAIRYFHHYGISIEEGKRILAKIAVKSHHNGAMNPKAHLRREVTVEDVCNAPMICFPLGLFDCCGLSDGGAAAILTTPEIARSLKKDYLLIKGIGLASSAEQNVLQDDYDYVHIEENVVCSKMAYEEADIKNPRKEVDIAEIHDCFTIHELLLYEDLGFSPRGKAKEDVENGTFTLEGDLPVNTDGGLKCFGHPLGASGIRMAYEIYNQLLGRAGPRQVRNARIGLVHTLGGAPGHNCAVVIFSRAD